MEGRVAGSTGLQLESLTRRFGSTVAVDGLDLDLREGSYTALVGPSGCGKSTTLRLIAGLDAPDSGRIVLDGRDITGLPPHRRPVNTVFQDYALFPHLNVGRNVEYGLRRSGSARPAVQAAEALERVRLGGFASRSIAGLSGGQRQRVALARALVNRPRVLLLDEPLGALDLELRRELQRELVAIQRETGTTFLHVTHDQEEALAIADTVVVLRAGALEQLGTPHEVYDRPRTAFVAGFLGRASVAPGEVAGRDGDAVLIDLGPVTVPVPLSRAERTSGRVLVGVRAERVGMRRATRDALASADGASVPLGRGRVVSLVYAGATTEYVVEVRGLPPIAVVEQAGGDARSADTDLAIAVGDEVELRWPRRHGVVLADDPVASADDPPLAR